MDPQAVPWFLEPTIEQIGAIRVAHAGIDDSIRQVIETLPAVQWPDHIAPAGPYGLAWTTESIDLAVAHTGKREYLLMTPKREMTVKKRHLVDEITRQWNAYLAEIPRAVDALERARTTIASHGIQPDYDALEIVRAIWMIEEQAVILWDYLLFERVVEIATDRQGGLLRIRVEKEGAGRPRFSDRTPAQPFSTMLSNGRTQRNSRTGVSTHQRACLLSVMPTGAHAGKTATQKCLSHRLHTGQPTSCHDPSQTSMTRSNNHPESTSENNRRTQ